MQLSAALGRQHKPTHALLVIPRSSRTLPKACSVIISEKATPLLTAPCIASRRSLPADTRASSKFFNPDTDPNPLRRTLEPEVMSDHTSSSYVDLPLPAIERRGVTPHPQVGHGRPTPTPKASADHVSASSTSSYAASISSSTFTLSSTTDGSSASSALFEGRPNQGQGTEDSGNNVFSIQLKKLYRAISNLETKIKQEDSMDEAEDGMNSRVMLKGKEVESDELERERWRKQISDHKE
ncbi:hypothetical protein NLJ89_g9546 [Agrocybe chaxingu]|uniref:Uncharacterized protein n=1 Tax=Agrocybe chaxingu TaxID=84603 RepID=A0A9W8JT81_9AGAR|nr:hypothetical protein NLJ89_g9546 [Agrocybe chaxingu]